MKQPENILFWHQSAWELFHSYFSQQRIPQALLICGREGLGKLKLARQMAQTLMCETPQNRLVYCGECPSCKLFSSQTHPDFLNVEPENESAHIVISQIRDLINFLQLKAQYNNYRVIILHPAERMNTPAANSFLKCLEEPAAKTVIFLLSEKPALLPATIVSRCQRMNLSQPDRTSALHWLKEQKLSGDPATLLNLAYGSPLLAKRFAQTDVCSLRSARFKDWLNIAQKRSEAVSIAESWLPEFNKNMLDWMLSWVMDIIKCRSGTENYNFYNPDFKQPLQELAQKLELKGLVEFYGKLLTSRTRLDKNLNQQLYIEEILIHWAKLNSEDYGRK